MSSATTAPPATLDSPVQQPQGQQQQQQQQALVLSPCGSCNKPINNQYVRALGSIYHANCFRCMDCNEIVTSKFFSFKLADGKQVPLCEVDYFRRLDLLCAKCGQALRGSYITATDKKYHVQHFTCSCCSTLFGPQDSYYEHQDAAQGTDVYCHYHYSTRCAQKCASCQTAILRQFVEVNRGSSSRDEAYHLPCHLIQKFWNVKISTPRPPQSGNGAAPWQAEEALYNAITLKGQQKQMDELVHRVWTVLSAYEESSAACISDLLKSVSNVVYLEAIRSAERFIFHVEVLFAVLDDLEFHFEVCGATKGIAHVRESRVLCRKTVDLFTQLSHTQRDVSRQGITQELLGLITGIAHYLKILLRIALLGALRLRREYNDAKAMKIFLDQLHRLMEENGDPLASRRITEQPHSSSGGKKPGPNLEVRLGGNTIIKEARSREGVAFGFKSLDPEVSGHSPYAQEYLDVQNGTRFAADFVPPSDLCVKCNGTIENGCIRLGTYSRWHVHCLTCDICGRTAGLPPPNKDKGESKASIKSIAETEKDEDSHEESEASRREIRAKLQERLQAEAAAESFTFILDPQRTTPPGLFVSPEVPAKVFCTQHRTGESHFGFQSVSRLEQYSYLLNVALLRLYSILKRRGAIQTPTGSLRRNPSSPRESMDLARLRTVSLDRRSTAVKTPKRLTIVESPVGKVAQTTSVALATDDTKLAPKKPSTPPSPKKQQKPTTPPSPKKPPQDTEKDKGAAPSKRPEFTRMNSQVVVMEEFPPQSSNTNTTLTEVVATQVLETVITEEPEEDHESLKLSDIQSLVEAEQAKDRRMSLLSSGSSGDTMYLSDIDQLDSIIVKHAALWLLNHSELKDKFDADDILEGIEIRKGGLWNKFFRGEKKVKKKGIFGVPLEILVERDGVASSSGVSRNTVKIPAFLDDLLTAMRQMDVSVEGIFRKNGNIRKMKEAIEALDEGGSVDFSQENPIQLAALLKKFFVEMPDPLLTHRLHALFLATQTVSDPAERTRLLHLACTLLPKSHRGTMEALFAFLKWVALFANMDSVGSKMDIPNLAIVVAPSILSAKSTDPQREQSIAAIGVVTQMLQEQDLFNRVPEQCLQLLADKKDLVKCANESSKDLLKKCHQHYTGTNKNGQAVKSPVTVQFAPSTLHNHKSDGSLDARGRVQFEKRNVRDSKSLERREPRDRQNTLRKPKPGLPHSPFSMPVGVGSGASTSTQKLPIEPTPLSLGALSAGAPVEPPASAPPAEPHSLPESNGHLT